MSRSPGFREELERLETIVRALEGDDLDLDEALTLFQEGVDRLKTARKLLQDADLTVKKVARAADAELADAQGDDHDDDDD